MAGKLVGKLFSSAVKSAAKDIATDVAKDVAKDVANTTKSTIKATAKDIASSLSGGATNTVVNKVATKTPPSSSWFDTNALQRQAEEKMRRKQASFLEEQGRQPVQAREPQRVQRKQPVQAREPQRKQRKQPVQAGEPQRKTHTGCTCSCPNQSGGSQLSSLKVTELRQIAGAMQIKGRSKMNKRELVSSVQQQGQQGGFY